MADTFTPYWGLTLPEVAASRDTWGTKLNADLAALDTLLQALQPIGAMIDFAGTVAPTGWRLCDGSLHSVTSLPRLFSVIGNRYGGDGVSTFAVPDLRARVTAGTGSTTGDSGSPISMSLGEKVGDIQFTLSQANLPNLTLTTTPAGDHSHPGSVTDIQGYHGHAAHADGVGDHQHLGEGTAFNTGGMSASGGGGITINTYDKWTSSNGAHSHGISVDMDGLHGHNLMITGAGSHYHSFGLGGSNTPLHIRPAMFGVTKIICCGPPSMQSLSNGLAPTGAVMASPLRGLN